MASLYYTPHRHWSHSALLSAYSCYLVWRYIHQHSYEINVITNGKTSAVKESSPGTSDIVSGGQGVLTVWKKVTFQIEYSLLMKIFKGLSCGRRIILVVKGPKTKISLIRELQRDSVCEEIVWKSSVMRVFPWFLTAKK